MTTGEAIALQLLAECYDLAALLSEQSQPVPPPEHSNYTNGVNGEGA